jgi:hypothetical protein
MYADTSKSWQHFACHAIWHVTEIHEYQYYYE